MEKTKNFVSQKITIIIIGAVLLIVAALVLGRILERREKISNTAQITQDTALKPGLEPVKVTRLDVAESALPAGIPTGLPLEASVKIVKNYTQTGSNGVSEAVHEYETKKTLIEVKDSYLAYFNKNNWTIDSELDTASSGLIVIAASKALQNVLVNISENTITKVRKVEITTSVITK